jgi:small subunit ribosomal protein S21
MSGIIVRDGESLESAIKRFKKKVEAEGILKTWKEKQFYLKPSARKREKRKESLRKYKTKQYKRDANRDNRGDFKPGGK